VLLSRKDIFFSSFIVMLPMKKVLTEECRVSFFSYVLVGVLIEKKELITKDPKRNNEFRR